MMGRENEDQDDDVNESMEVVEISSASGICM
jgi:hypothetical protein